ncbi:MAG TPA: AraC family transcriptional regulator [Usitatibacter sp.]|jgi:AraC family transcriptional regulator|nr:AraC family transcriptional regulator [Usitatibacter sp.]
MTTALAAGAYYGGVRRRVESREAILSRVVHRTARSLPAHEHARAYFCMLLAGRYAEAFGTGEIDYRPLQVGFHPALRAHRDAVGPEGAAFLCLEIDPGFAAAWRPRRDPLLLPDTVSVQMLALHHAMCDGTLSPALLESAVWELCADAHAEPARRERGTPRWLVEAIGRLHDGFGEPLTVRDVAMQVGVHPVHVSREFRARFGLTLGAYLNRVRVRAACGAIGRGASTLAAIAADCGFADHAHFCRVFRKAIGCTPSQFARAARVEIAD